MFIYEDYFHPTSSCLLTSSSTALSCELDDATIMHGCTSSLGNLSLVEFSSTALPEGAVLADSHSICIGYFFLQVRTVSGAAITRCISIFV